MKTEGRMLVLILCLMALTAGGVQIVAQEKQTDAEAKRLVAAEQRKAKRAIDVEQMKAKRAAEAERRKAKRAIDAEQSKAKRAVKAEQLKLKLVTQAKRREMPLDGTFRLLSSKLNTHAKLVKGAPYSAIAVTESTHTLSDGNQINQRDEVTYFRDSEGRIRIEQTLKKIGKWVPADGPKRIIMIADPVAGHSYYLDANERKATKAPLFHKVVDPAERLKEAVQRQKLAWERQKRLFEEQSAKQKRLFDEQWERRRRALETQRSTQGQASQASEEQWAKEKLMFEQERAKQKQEFDERSAKRKQLFEEQLAKRRLSFEESMSKPNPEKSVISSTTRSSTVEKPKVATSESLRGKKTEDLGKRVVEGVEASGTRTTLTIPAGEIGNLRPIHVVDERWYSKELQTPVMTRHHDPRSGDTVFRLRNINRAEPARSLFEVPADYTIIENPRGRFGTTNSVLKPAGFKIETKPAIPDPPKPQTGPPAVVKPTSPTNW